MRCVCNSGLRYYELSSSPQISPQVKLKPREGERERPVLEGFGWIAGVLMVLNVWHFRMIPADSSSLILPDMTIDGGKEQGPPQHQHGPQVAEQVNEKQKRPRDGSGHVTEAAPHTPNLVTGGTGKSG